jgi:CheY-like chemotaxis protein
MAHHTKGTALALPLPTPGCPRIEVCPPKEGTVLLIDDDGLFATAIERCLNAEHHVQCAGSAAAALHLIGSGSRFDVILCDLMMPEMSGMDLHAALCATHPDQARRMIFLTGGAFTVRAQEFLESVPNVWTEKPVEIPTLQALVKDVIRGANRPTSAPPALRGEESRSKKTC